MPLFKPARLANGVTGPAVLLVVIVDLVLSLGAAREGRIEALFLFLSLRSQDPHIASSWIKDDIIGMRDRLRFGNASLAAALDLLAPVVLVLGHGSEQFHARGMVLCLHPGDHVSKGFLDEPVALHRCYPHRSEHSLDRR